MRSFALLKTNVGLTTNIKVTIDSDYNLSLNSIESKDELANSKYKKVNFISKNYFDELFSYFYGDLPTEIAYYIKYDNDSDSMSNIYSSQYDELYQYGARNITNNKDYKEEYEYFAPLYISPNNLPKKFIIFRVDGAGIDTIDRNNIKANIFNKFKTVKLFDLETKTNLGKWLDINFNNNNFFPKTPFEMSFSNLEFSKWNGIDYETGGYISKSAFLQNIYEDEKEIFEFEKYIFNGWKNNKIVFPNIINMSFLFDDTPATPDKLRKWSINRYYGFYLDDMINVKSISPYKIPSLRNDVVILDGNILYSPSYTNPFIDNNLDRYYIEYNNNYYFVEKVTESNGLKLKNVKKGNVVTQEYLEDFIEKWKIISDIDLTGKEGNINNNTVTIGDSSNYPNRLLNSDLSNFQLEDWDSADVWIIEINGLYHNLIRESGIETNIDGINVNTTRIIINTDYAFLIDNNNIKYWINKDDPSFSSTISLLDENGLPVKFSIFKLKFSDIKDFDTRIIDTDFSKYEYEDKFNISNTDETKIYLTNPISKSSPKEIDDFIYNNEVINIPVSSEYTANYETFKIENGELSDIWRKNPVYCRWGFQNSISSNDYPYILNNSKTFEDYNRTCNPFDPNPNRVERNLDYFYSINSSTYSYLHHTLHIEEVNSNGIDTSYKFELDKYINIGTYSIGDEISIYDYDYFNYFFERKSSFYLNQITKNTIKYSTFNTGDNSIPNISLFKGIKFLIYEVDDIKKGVDGKISSLNLKMSNKFDGWKLSILLSDNDYTTINIDGDLAGLTQSNNQMSWSIFDEWKMDKSYNYGDIVIYDDILYISTTSSNITLSPTKQYSLSKITKSAPYNQDNWTNWTPINNQTTVFWNPTGVYPGYGVGSGLNGPGSGGDVVYNNGDYYIYNSSGTDDFWNPVTSDLTGYSTNDIVLFKSKYYMSMTSSNKVRPDYQSPYIVNSTWNYYWVATQSQSPKWSTIEIWNPSKSYTASYVIHNEKLYSCQSSITGNEPGVSVDWSVDYNLTPDSDIIYDEFTNPIIEMNNSYYIINSNTSNSKLENGINIYINEKWENILININISDNTIPNISNSNRDDLYNELNSKITAYNFINAINDISNKYGFSDFLNYIVIKKDGTLYKYNYNNIDNIPYYIVCETPDEVKLSNKSLELKPIELPIYLKPNKILTELETTLDNINYYNKIPVACNITSDDKSKSITKSDIIYRYSGYYMPIFQIIDIFSKNTFTASAGNYKFDTSLTDFGILKERKVSKVNHLGSRLKLGENSYKSIYPMLDEFGYTTIDSFIFKSNWDMEYYITTEKPNIDLNDEFVKGENIKSTTNGQTKNI